MNKYLNIFLIIGLTIFMNECSTKTIIVDSQTKIDESSKVEWVITKKDSIIDFRKFTNGYAKVQNNDLFYSTKNDSLNKLSMNELKVIYLKEDTHFTAYIIGGIVVAIVVIS